MRTAALACLLLASVPAGAKRPVIGAPPPDFALMNSAGRTRTLASYKGQVVFINFWASWCEPCRAELPLLNRLALEKKGKVRVVAINADNKRSKAAALLDALRMDPSPMEILWDPRSRVIAAYDPPAMPSSYILDPAGVVRFSHAGFHDGDEASWRKEIDGLLRGRALKN